MQFERSELCPRPSRTQTAPRVWSGTVHGQPDCWVVVARDDRDLMEWEHWEDLALEVAPLRICRAILDDGVLLLEESLPEDFESFSDPF